MKGFTLIELLIVFGIMGALAIGSITVFSSYNKSQVFGAAVSDFSSFLNTARSRAISQVKPAVCTDTNPLVGYKVAVTISGQGYSLYSVCLGIADSLISTKRLPGQVMFQSGQPNILFNVSTGTVSSPGAIVLSGFGSDVIATVTIDSNGNISSTNGVIAAATPTSTPTVSCSKDYYYSPPYCVPVGGDNGNYCDSSCGGQVGGPTATSTPGVPPTATSTPTPPPLPDLVIAGVSTPVSSAKSPSFFPITITVSNQGTGTFTGSNVAIGIYYDKTPPITYSTIISTQTVFSGTLAPGASQTVTYQNGTFAAAGTHTIYALVDRAQTVAESDNSNNAGGPQSINITYDILKQKFFAKLGLENIENVF